MELLGARAAAESISFFTISFLRHYIFRLKNQKWVDTARAAPAAPNLVIVGVDETVKRISSLVFIVFDNKLRHSVEHRTKNHGAVRGVDT